MAHRHQAARESEPYCFRGTATGAHYTDRGENRAAHGGICVTEYCACGATREAMRLTLTKSDGLEDWWIIERAEHDGWEWVEENESESSFFCSSRFSDNADVEGTSEQMLAIAQAIKARGKASFKRCAVQVRGNTVQFMSPRNSRSPGECSLAEADELADIIFAHCGICAG